MKNVLPDSTAPYITVEINGLAYQYTMVKDPEADATVTISNEDAANPGTNIFEETDDWSGNPGGTVRKYFRFDYTDSSRWGDGKISVEGEGTVMDPFVVYNYKMVVDESFQCFSPLSNPSCPGYSTALAEYLASLAQPPSIGDPYYDEWVQAELNREANRDEEELEQADNSNEVEDDLEEQLGGNNNIDKFKLDQDIFKGRLVIIDKNAPNLKSLYNNFKSNDDDEIDDLISYCMLYALEYYVNDSSWNYFSSIKRKLPKNISETKIFYSKRKYDIVEDDNFLYLLFIKDFKFKGSISPFSVEKDKIKSLIQNENKISYIKMLEKNIVNDAKLSNDIKIY